MVGLKESLTHHQTLNRSLQLTGPDSVFILIYIKGLKQTPVRKTKSLE